MIYGRRALVNKLPAALAPLAGFRQFLTWFPVWDPKKEKWTKVPTASVTNPNAWLSFDEAAARIPENGGVGFVFTENDPFFFLDIDGALQDNGTWSPLAVKLCEIFRGAAVEVSHSGHGLHIIGANGTIPPHSSRGPHGLEFYSARRFVALTGFHARGAADTAPPGAVEWLINEYFPPRAAETVDLTDEPDPEWDGPEDDGELIQRALASRSAAAIFGGRASFADLWEGNEDALAAAYPDETNPGRAYDASAADAALCHHLAFWTGKNAGRIDRLFRQSALNRDKWDARPDYRAATIGFAVSKCREVYKARRPRSKPAPSPAPSRTAGAPAAGAPAAGVPQAELLSGFQFLGPAAQTDLFRGCVYIRDLDRVFVPDGALLKREQFRAFFGGYTFAIDSINERTSRNAFEAFTESQGVRFPKVHAACFRPELEPGAIVNEEGRSLVNVFVPVPTPRKDGDPSPFLNHLAAVLPDKRDREILLSYMAAVVQFPGVKFQWAPLLQGVEGNGKTLFITCLANAVGHKYTHLPNAADIGNKFNSWILSKLFIGLEEIQIGDRQEVIDTLKALITNDRIEIQGKGTNQETGDNRANFFLCSNYKNAVRKTLNDRRYCVLFSAQQEFKHLARDGMGGDYFPNLYAWLRADGFAIVTKYLAEYDIPDEFNPATACHRAPVTTSTAEAVEVSRGAIEQEVLEAIDEGRAGFCGGWVSSRALDTLLEEGGWARRMPVNRRKDLLRGLGYIPHPALVGGRVNVNILQENGKPRLYVQEDGDLAALSQPAEIVRAYVLAQGWV